MANYNKIILVGNLTRDPQLKYLPSQMAVAEFGLAVNHKFRTKSGEDREEVLFIDCACFGKGGEIINPRRFLIHDGRACSVGGRRFDLTVAVVRASFSTEGAVQAPHPS